MTFIVRSVKLFLIVCNILHNLLLIPRSQKNLAKDHFLTDFTHILKGHIQRIENIYYKENDLFSFHSHEAIIDALEHRDLDQAKEAMRDNWLHTLKKMNDR